MKRFFLTVVIAFLIFPVAGFARPTEGCFVESRGGNGETIPYQDVRFPAVLPSTFDPNVPDGTVIYDASGMGDNYFAVVMCGVSELIGNMVYEGTGRYNAKFNAYETPVSGVGYRITDFEKDGWWPKNINYQGIGKILLGANDYRVQLVKTGPITAAGVLSGEIGTIRVLDHGGLVAARVSFNGGLPIRPTVPTCTIQKKRLDIGLGEVSLLQLERSGGSDYKPFSIDLQCSGGSTGASTRMFITLTDSTNPGNRGNRLTLSSKGSTAAKGVAVEIRRADDSMVSFGPDSKITGNPNQWFVGQFGNTSTSIPLRARYVTTSSPLAAGQANAAATFTMSYQ
ncbi:fimbrial protein [Pseudomonas paraeruginosa]|uniref:fimbrial protein n=1 Tax=Pseudomonas paraeruginosa TaxID=2994495 RepID=UPI0037498C0B